VEALLVIAVIWNKVTYKIADRCNSSHSSPQA